MEPSFEGGCSMSDTTVNIAKDFTRYPAGRYKRNGKTSGEEFREKFLVPTLAEGGTVRIELDGTIGYGSSFLEEAFGGLVRSLHVSSSQLLSRLELRTDNAALRQEIEQYINDASQSAALAHHA